MLSAATLAAHLKSPDGFRATDLLFMFRLFLNWNDGFSREHRPDLKIQVVQIQRYLHELCNSKSASLSVRAGQKLYTLTPGGITTLIQTLTPADDHFPLDELIFCSYFVRTYGPRLLELSNRHGHRMSTLTRSDLGWLLRPDALDEHLRSVLDRRIARLELRLKECRSAWKLSQSLKKQGLSPSMISDAVEKDFPYELNPELSFSEVLSKLPKDLQTFELEQGLLNRAELLWEPTLQLLVQWRKRLGKSAEKNPATP
jgi:hypothetical protein